MVYIKNQLIHAIALVAIVMSSLLFINSCREDDTTSTEIDYIDALPTDDLLSEKCDLTAYISPKIEDNAFTSALKKRFTKKTNVIDKDTKVVILNGQDIYDFSSDATELAEAYCNNARILVYNANMYQIKSLNFFISTKLIDTTATSVDDIFTFVDCALDDIFAEDPDSEDRWVLYGMSIHDDFYLKSFIPEEDDELTTSEFLVTNEDGELEVANECLEENDEVHELSNFEYGLFADVTVCWIDNIESNRLKVAELKSSLMNATKADKELESLIQYKTVTHTISYTTNFSDVKTSGSDRFWSWLGEYWIHGSVFTRTVPVEVQIQYAGLHSFNDDCDYFIFKQHLKSSNKSYNCPVNAKDWTNIKASGVQDIYSCGPYMKGISVTNDLLVFKHLKPGNSFLTPDGKAKVELLSGKIFPYNENKETPVNQSFSFAIGKGFSFGLGGFKASASLDKGIDLGFTQQYKIDKITVTKSSKGSEISWNYEGGRILGHTKGTCHDVVPTMQRSDCDMDQAYIYKVYNPNNSIVAHTTSTTLSSEVLYGNCAPAWFYDNYQVITQKQSDLVRTFTLPRLARYTYTWKRYLNSDTETAEKINHFINTYFPKYSEKTIEAFDIYSKEEMCANNDLWKASWLGVYFRSFEKDLKASAELFRSVDGPGVGTYTIGYKNTDGDQTWDIVYTINVPESGEVSIDVEYKGFNI